MALRASPLGCPTNAFTLYIYFTNENRSVKEDFVKTGKQLKEFITFVIYFFKVSNAF